MDRRTFMMSAAAAAASEKVSGANDRPGLALIGAGNRGQYLMRAVNEIGGAEWIAVADVYRARNGGAEKTAHKELRKYYDYRRVLEDKDVDAVIIAAPDHWHARMLVDAVHAGKDVFCEKPMTASPMQGHRIVKAVRESGRIVQIGTQQRSLPIIEEAKGKFIDSGILGTVNQVHCYWNRNAGYLMPNPLPAEFQKRPDDLDWNAWLGDLPKVPWDPKRFLRPFVYWAPSTGPTGNLLIHFLDVIHWYLGLTKPASSIASGGIYYLKDGRDVPDTFVAALEYPESVMVTYGSTVADQNGEEGEDMIFMGSGGRLHVFRSGYKFLPSGNNTAMGVLTARGTDGPQHVKNWLECVRSRQQPNSNVVDGHYLAAACHLANAAYFRNQRAYWQEEWDLETN
jgi:predicted dehydrogenase